MIIETLAPKQEKIIRQNYVRLFLETSGVIIASGAIPEEYAWGIENVGTFLTMSLIDGLRAAVKVEGGASWEVILSQLDERVNLYKGPGESLRTKS